MIYVFMDGGLYEGTRNESTDPAHETVVPPPDFEPASPLNPGEAWYWNGSAWEARIDPVVLSSVVDSVNPERTRRLEILTVTVGGVVYDADSVSRNNLQGLLTATAIGVPVPWPITWRCADNVDRQLDISTAAAVAGTMLGAVQALYTASWHLKDTVIPGLNAADLVNFNVAADGNWP